MRQPIREQDYEDALDACAAEPVHIPGSVQPFASLIGIDASTREITYASENCGDIIGIPATRLLGTAISDTFDVDIEHALNNAKASKGFTTSSIPLGTFRVGDASLDLRAFGSGGTVVVQLEPARDAGLGGKDALNTLGFLMGEIQSCTTQASLFDLSIELMRHISGYDRVMIYKFDPDFNGEVIAEARQRNQDAMVGLRFPSWDIPEQARAIMAKLPLRFIEDADQIPVQLLAANGSLPPLDITFADCRGVSPIHMEYLRNMNAKATMTLSIVVEGALWGMISFHHRHRRVPSAKMRDVLTAFASIFCSKLSVLVKQTQLDLVRRTDSIKDSVLGEIEGEEALEGSISRIGEVVEDVLKADGIAFMVGSRTICHGSVPDQAVLDHVFAQLHKQMGVPVVTDSLKETYVDFADQLQGCAGMIASAVQKHRALMIFRKDAAQTIAWAGNPEKEISEVSGTMRLAPRGSFSTYLQKVEGRSAPWTSDDIYFAERIWVLIDSAETRSLKNSLTRQQTLMINELNHRVRNILSLVRSVSRQARRHNGSLESYSASLESRVQALASAHDIAAGSGVGAIDIKTMIEMETLPYNEGRSINISGVNPYLKAAIAPIFSLIIHELATNAAKYGALSVDGGQVDVVVSDEGDGASIVWTETAGPKVATNRTAGFGTMLIEQAVPHEMGGTAKLTFNKTGVEATFFFPKDILERFPSGQNTGVLDEDSVIDETDDLPFDASAWDGFVLVLEDNFMIAQDLKDQLGDIGLDDIATLSTSESALELLETEIPVFAILDINLGETETSEAVALRLLKMGVPFVFVTGYGDRAELIASLQSTPRLSKPVDSKTLQNIMMAMIP